MSVGKGSMARAAKAAGQDGKTTEQAVAAKTAEKKGAAKKSAASPKKASGKTPKAPVAAAEIIAAPTEAVMQQVVYQKSSGMLERDAAPNEIFGLGDAMPVYYF